MSCTSSPVYTRPLSAVDPLRLYPVPYGIYRVSWRGTRDTLTSLALFVSWWEFLCLWGAVGRQNPRVMRRCAP
eukprot:7388151-Prymnesium_polylepis.1